MLEPWNQLLLLGCEAEQIQFIWSRVISLTCVKEQMRGYQTYKGHHRDWSEFQKQCSMEKNTRRTTSHPAHLQGTSLTSSPPRWWVHWWTPWASNRISPGVQYVRSARSVFIEGACRIASQMLPVALTCATSAQLGFEVPQMRMVKARPRNPLDSLKPGKKWSDDQRWHQINNCVPHCTRTKTINRVSVLVASAFSGHMQYLLSFDFCHPMILIRFHKIHKQYW
jgi:hypothetical protein